MNFTEYMTEIEKKIVIRKGVKKIIKKASRDGYKIVGGREVRMSSDELRSRKKGAKKAKLKNKSKHAQIARNREKSLRKRSTFAKKKA